MGPGPGAALVMGYGEGGCGLRWPVGTFICKLSHKKLNSRYNAELKMGCTFYPLDFCNNEEHCSKCRK